MSEPAIVLPVVRLMSTRYSVPCGSYGIIEQREPLAVVRWLPPRAGVSSGVDPSDLRDAGELILPTRYLETTPS